tara:strand:- start:174 stop:653 length:480 start_codon:yes stop_codon:yes gene_type:complete
MAIKPRRIKANTTTDYLGSWQVMNESGVDIAKGNLVQVSGVNSSGAFLLVKLLDVGAAVSALVDAPKFVAGMSIPNGGNGSIRENYIDTAAVTKTAAGTSSVGDSVYAALSGSAGSWTTEDDKPGGSPIKVGIVVKVSSAQDVADGVVLLAPQARVGAA